jgi:NAD-dependent dihydropyrimidine dehydrogenase PreA subunit
VLLAGLLNHWGQLGPAELPGKRRTPTARAVAGARTGMPLRFPPGASLQSAAGAAPVPGRRRIASSPVDAIFAHIWDTAAPATTVERCRGRARVWQSPTCAPRSRAGGEAAARANGAERDRAGRSSACRRSSIDGQLFWGNDCHRDGIAYLDGPQAVRDENAPHRHHAGAARRPGAQGMTMLPPPSAKKLGLVIDLDTCVGCHACAVACKEWNAGGIAGRSPTRIPTARSRSACGSTACTATSRGRRRRSRR